MCYPLHSPVAASLPEPLPVAINLNLFPLFSPENIPTNAVFQRAHGVLRTKPCIFDDPQMVPRLAMAFCIGATMEEAAHFAGCSVSAIKKHMREQTPIQVPLNGIATTLTFDALVALWRSHLTLLAKVKIYRDLLDPTTGTKSAWKILERFQPEEWGKRTHRGHGHGAGDTPTIDLGLEAAKRMSVQ